MEKFKNNRSHKTHNLSTIEQQKQEIPIQHSFSFTYQQQQEQLLDDDLILPEKRQNIFALKKLNQKNVTNSYRNQPKPVFGTSKSQIFQLSHLLKKFQLFSGGFLARLQTQHQVYMARRSKVYNMNHIIQQQIQTKQYRKLRFRLKNKNMTQFTGLTQSNLIKFQKAICYKKSNTVKSNIFKLILFLILLEFSLIRTKSMDYY